MTYIMPAEWEPHEATWLAWPHNVDHWPGKFEPIPAVFAAIAKALLPSEKVYICVNDDAMEQSARSALRAVGVSLDSDRLTFFHIPTNTSWARDHGPIFVRNEKGERVITDWIFNTWGGKYPPFDLDDVVPQKIGGIFKVPVLEPGIVMEGGSLEVNGQGTLLTTTQCLLNKNRNPHLTQAQIEGYLNKYLGATKVLWLEEGIIGDDTDGHIDDIARFVNPTTIVCAIEDNTADENYSILQKNHEDLKKMTDQDDRPLSIETIPMPDPVIHEGQRLPASYINFYIGNSVVLVPTFRDRHDAEALATLGRLFPGRKIVGIDCVDLVWGLGTIHCSTQQQPQ